MKLSCIAFQVIVIIGLHSCETQIGSDGKQALLKPIPEPAGENCSSGGYRIESGIDLNSNGTLESEEIQSSIFICNGNDGEDGDNGVDGLNGSNGVDGLNGLNGVDGKQFLLSVLPETESEHCADGGFKIETGIDDNSNGILDSSEVNTLAYVFNGVDGVVVEQIRFDFGSGRSGITTTGIVWNNLQDLRIPFFDITRYPGVDSVIFVLDLKVSGSNAESIVELYNFSDNMKIENGELRTNSTSLIQVRTSMNLLNSIPKKEIAFVSHFVRFKRLLAILSLKVVFTFTSSANFSH